MVISDRFLCIVSGLARRVTTLQTMQFILLQETCMSILITLKPIFKPPIKTKPSLFQITVWPENATSHYMNQRWPSLVKPIGVTKPRQIDATLLNTNRYDIFFKTTGLFNLIVHRKLIFTWKTCENSSIIAITSHERHGITVHKTPAVWSNRTFFLYERDITSRYRPALTATRYQ